MSYLLALDDAFPGAIATTSPIVPASELPALQDAMALSARLTQLLATQEQQVTQACEEARAQGREEGLEQGRAQALESGAQALSDTLEKIAREQAAQREELRGALVTLASSMVRCMAAELAPPDVLAALAERAFEHVVNRPPARSSPGWRPCSTAPPNLLNSRARWRSSSANREQQHRPPPV